jgi:hypothetical protein
MEIKCQCQKCGERIAFDGEHSGRLADCPHCGRETTLYIPAPTKAPVRAVGAHYVTSPQSQAAAGDDLENLIVAGYVTALFLPLIGFIIGIILLAKNRTGSGIKCAIISVVAAGFWFAAFTS